MSQSRYVPSLEEARAHQGDANLLPVYREIAADLETPVSAYLKIVRGRYGFLLESVEGGERLGRYSFIGSEPRRVIRTGHRRGGAASYRDPLPPLREELQRFRLSPVPDLPRFHGGAVGYLAYEVARYFERLPQAAPDPLGVPESIFLLTDTLLVFDHLRHRIKVVTHAPLDGDRDAAYQAAVERIEGLVERLRRPLPRRIFHPVAAAVPLPASVNMTQAEYEARVRRVQEYIRAGDIFQAIVSLRLSRPTSAPPFNLYRALRAVNPSPYMYFLHLGDFQIIGASPEPLVQVQDGVISTHPPAGTRPRGATPAEDLALEQELRQDEKERAEHVMLVDLARNDLGRVSQPGTVRVTQFMDIDRFSHVMHLVSHVVGELRPEVSAFDAVRACFPAGTVSGAPKIRAMEIIAEQEPHGRGTYAGVVGYLSYTGNLDTAITIRTIVLRGGVAHVQAGAGIVYDSVPEREYRECLNKAQALLRAIDEAEAGVTLE